MKRRKALWVVGLFILVAGGVLLMWPRKSTPFHLKIVRQTVEQGKPVVYFRVEGGEGKRIWLGNFWRVFDYTIDGPNNATSSLNPMNDFWPPSQQLPTTFGSSNARKEFGVLTTNYHQSWKLSVTVWTEGGRISLGWLKLARLAGDSFGNKASLRSKLLGLL